MIYAHSAIPEGAHSEGTRILLIHRGAREGDSHAGKWNGLGGKQEADESPIECARREFREEAGVDLPEARFRVLGFLQFPNFKPHKSEDWMVTVLETELIALEVEMIARECAEGALHWKAPAEFGQLNFWPGDRYFLPFVLERRPFAGTIWYRDGVVARQEISALASSDLRRDRNSV